MTAVSAVAAAAASAAASTASSVSGAEEGSASVGDAEPDGKVSVKDEKDVEVSTLSLVVGWRK